MSVKIQTEINKAILEVKIAEEKYTSQLPKLLIRVKNKLLRNIDRQFTDSQDPYGSAWEKTKKKTGKTLIASTALRRAFEGEIQGDLIKLGVEATRAKVAGIHHFGVQPYTITAKNGKALRFLSQDGSIIYRKSVRHPGFPRRLLLPTTERGLPDSWRIDIQEILSE
jgi:phage gpG-like protein